MPSIERYYRQLQVIKHVETAYVKGGTFALNGHFLTRQGLSWHCIWCSGQLEVDANLQQLRISSCLSAQCQPGLDCSLSRTERIP